jgi:hypothetical protein
MRDGRMLSGPVSVLSAGKNFTTLARLFAIRRAPQTYYRKPHPELEVENGTFFRNGSKAVGGEDAVFWCEEM